MEEGAMSQEVPTASADGKDTGHSFSLEVSEGIQPF